MSHPDKKEIASLLNEIAVLMQLKGENPFRVRAFENAARAIERIQEPLETVIAEGKLVNIKGIGATIARIIEAYWQTGEEPEILEELRKTVPPGLLELLEIPGLGPGRVRTLYEKLGIATIEDLEQALEKGQLSNLEGFGPKTLDKIKRGLDMYRTYQGRYLLGHAYPLAVTLTHTLKENGIRAEVVGSIRRWCPVVRNIDILIEGPPSKAILEIWQKEDFVFEPLDMNGTRWTLRNLDLNIPVVVLFTPEDLWPWALRYFTGSRGHNLMLDRIAGEKGYQRNGWVYQKNGEIPAIQTEAEIYALMGLDYIPPECRENRDEFEIAASGTFPTLVNADDIRGVVHVHSHYSDGADPIRDLLEEARTLGLEYVGISDHSQAAHYANGLDASRLEKQWEEIEQLQRAYPDIRILKGMEVDILADGSLDLDEDHLKQLDFVVASIHSRFQMDREAMTERIIKAIRNPYTTILGHPTGRLLLSREPYAVDLEAVLDAAAETGTLIEINANPHRLDLDWEMMQVAVAKGVRMIIDPDTHKRKDLSDYIYGVGVARKGRLTADWIANTLSAGELLELFQAIRRKKGG